MSAFLSPLDLSSLAASAGVRLAGSAPDEWAAYTISSAGDLNGDGVGDIVVGDFLGGAMGRTGPGSVYVLFGKTSGWANLSLADLGSAGFVVSGIAAAAGNEQQGIPVASAGDLNGDGFDDLLIGAPLADNNGRTNSGSVFVIYGHAGGFSNISLSAPLGSAITRIDGRAAGEQLGRSLAGLGDSNGDGYADILLGAQVFPAAGSVATGAAYLLHGGVGQPGLIDLASPPAGVQVGSTAYGFNKSYVASAAGDFNGDGLADMLFADPYSGTPAGGFVQLSLGRADGAFGTTAGVDQLSILNDGYGYGTLGGGPAGLTGSSVAAAGDVNGDGYADIIIGASGSSYNGRNASGAAYVVFGHAGALPDLALGNLGNGGFRIEGAVASDAAGAAVASAGDVNGDGYADILVGGPAASHEGRGGNGSVWLILGHAGGFGTIDLANPDSNVVRVDGGSSFDRLGASLASAGDVDGDGFADLLLGANLSDPAGVRDAGSAYLLFSQSTGGALYRGTTLADTLRGTPDGDTLLGYGQNDRLFGMAGDDTLNGGAGNDFIDGGAGTDTAFYSGLVGQYAYGVIGDQAIISGADGTDRLSGVEFFQFANGERISTSSFVTNTGALYVTSGGLGSGFRMPDLYGGPVTRLQIQLLGSATGDIVLGTNLNDFFNLLGGDDAVQAGAGDDVIDGGTGSNFLTGGAGRDDFFLDGRGLATTWSTITDWQAGETLSVFGWTPGVSRMLWRDNDGTEGYKGVTLHADLDGNGVIETSVTWTGLTQAALPTPLSLAGLLWFT